uniref:Uncharacterized protein n=1 Tax=Oryza brachyantha TaxID=4533 RepID=J3L4D0_ORYBR
MTHRPTSAAKNCFFAGPGHRARSIEARGERLKNQPKRRGGRERGKEEEEEDGNGVVSREDGEVYVQSTGGRSQVNPSWATATGEQRCEPDSAGKTTPAWMWTVNGMDGTGGEGKGKGCRAAGVSR